MERWCLLVGSARRAFLPLRILYPGLSRDGGTLLPSLKKMTTSGGSRKRVKATNVFGSCLLPGFLLSNRGTKSFPKDRNKSLDITLKYIIRNGDLSKVCACLPIRDKSLHVKKSLGGVLSPTITKATTPLTMPGSTNRPSPHARRRAQHVTCLCSVGPGSESRTQVLTKIISQKGELRVRCLSPPRMGSSGPGSVPNFEAMEAGLEDQLYSFSWYHLLWRYWRHRGAVELEWGGVLAHAHEYWALLWNIGRN